MGKGSDRANEREAGLGMKYPRSPDSSVDSVSAALGLASRVISQGGRFVAAACLFALMFYITADVICRTVFGAPLKGTLEVSQIMLLVVVFFAIADTQAKTGHVRIELFSDHWPPRIQAILGILYCVIGLGLFSMMLVYGSTVALSDMHNGVTTDQLGIPLFLAKAVIPVGALLMILELITNLVGHFRQVIGTR